ncbi:MAG: hypothetical protein L0Z51_02980 [Candidatus Latescibacteria bacterium]|nr:hypothetical protein [Candidatus Latescibacterota bacterium]
MSRFVWVLCVLVLTATPVVASPSIHYERSDLFRHAINAVIGDASYVERYGSLPPPGADPDLRVRTHLEFVHALLSARDVSALASLRAARRENLARLRDYIDAGVFPRNHLYADQNRPCFIDRDGRICAVGYLVEQSAGREAAERINSAFQSEFLWRMHLPELDGWISASGLTLLELSMIQPCYDPEFHVTVSRISEMTVSVRGYVVEFCCGMKFVAFDFGESMWVSPIENSIVYIIDIQHTYTRPGSYAITSTAVATDLCYNDVETMSWLVSVGAPAMQLSAVEIPGGPPYRVYLTTTDEINLDCLTSTVVHWNIYDPPASTSWYFENGVYRTPVHEYAWSGVMSIAVSNSYQADCAMNQAGAVTVNVNGAAGPEVSTWGRIKSMYR